MQLAGYALTQASRIAIIILLFQLLGIGPALPVTLGSGLQYEVLSDRDHLPPTLDPALASDLAPPPESRPRASGPVETPSLSRRPASVPLARWLPRAPPVV